MKSPAVSSAMILAFLLCGLGAAYADSATWNLHPTGGDWNTAANWTPQTTPNGPDDLATFGVSSQTAVSLSQPVEVDSIVFDPGASAYTITLAWLTQQFLVISGTGIVNNSGVSQNFVRLEDAGTVFENNATVGNLTVFSNPASANLGQSNGITFLDNSSAGNGTFINGGNETTGGSTTFSDDSSAGNATIINEGAGAGDGPAGATYFFGNANAGTATIINEGGAVAGGGGGTTHFDNIGATAANSTIISNGGWVEGAQGGTLDFLFGTVGNATLIANGTFPDIGAGLISLSGSSIGGTARVELFGTGTLELEGAGRRFVVGSIEGDGVVSLGANILEVGGNNRSTLFAGVIGGNLGSLTKVGVGILKLSGANTYTGGTILTEGGLVIKNTTGSGTGIGAVQINRGILAGNGTIAGPVNVGIGSGTGAFLTPGRGASTATTLTIQSGVTFKADGTYTCRLNSKKTKADQLIANGVTIESGAQFVFKVMGDEQLRVGKSRTVISNTAATPISGTFANLPDNSIFTSGPNTFQASYFGGDGNDLTLTVVP